MKEQISFSTFYDRFMTIRPDNFTYNGLRSLYDYLEEYEEVTDIEIELDVIALCCEYNEYSDIEDYLKYYDTDVDKEDYLDPDIDCYDTDDFNEAVLEEISNKTTIIKVNDDGFIIQLY